MKCIIFTNNLKKCNELKHLLSSLNLPVFRYTDGFSPSLEVIEDGLTFEANALKKLSAISHLNSHILIADDSGLEIDCLNGEPGVFSARYGGDSLSDIQRCDYVLSKMKRSVHRNARFRCVIALQLPQQSPITFEGVVAGTISHSCDGKTGFGYDPIFIPSGYSKTFASLGSEIKDSCSHRSRALAKVFLHLNAYTHLFTQ